ncbi:hypothetical protein [Natrinema pallidum]|uniref:Uncharacterized protein n=1 Tax=Natrinema pallidum TaxID=69527 RepID=A0A4P9TGF8_9EURY|nr:hypothetical protein [Natrinema pallidum]QCW02830.1 hypothetical protein FGF80_06080 [Natrinema pallidum]
MSDKNDKMARRNVLRMGSAGVAAVTGLAVTGTVSAQGGYPDYVGLIPGCTMFLTANGKESMAFFEEPIISDSLLAFTGKQAEHGNAWHIKDTYTNRNGLWISTVESKRSNEVFYVDPTATTDFTVQCG